jgi:hypothetical protein
VFLGDVDAIQVVVSENCICDAGCLFDLPTDFRSRRARMTRGISCFT